MRVAPLLHPLAAASAPPLSCLPRRHHEDRYVDRDSKNLAEWFAADAPAHVDVALFAGDLGLELSAELSGRSRGTVAYVLKPLKLEARIFPQRC